MSDANTTSTGTVQVRKSGTKNKVIFVPDNDHSAMNGKKKKYAVFFAVKGDNGHRLRKLDADGKGTPLQLQIQENRELFFAVLSAATTRIKVDIIVDRDFRITGITVPAK